MSLEKSMVSEFADKLAHECMSHYKKLGKKGKPLLNEEWTLLSCFALSISEDGSNSTIVAAATGTKCLGCNQMQPGGSLVNDSHAEVLARRCLLRYIYDQISIFKSTGSSEIIIGLDAMNRYKINPQVKFHFFSSHVPCGDASIIPKLSNQGNKRKNSLGGDEQEPLCKKIKGMDNLFDICENGAYDGKKIKFEENVGEEVEIDIHRTGAKSIGESDSRLPGALYHMVGVVRTKPGRGDPTLSVSCSDKLARWLRCGVQGALLSLLLSQPVMLSSIVIGQGGPFSKEVLERAVTRAKPHNPPLLLSSRVEFPHSRYQLSTAARPCPSALLWAKVRHKPLDVCVEGRRQGCTKKSGDCGRLMICKLELLRTFTTITGSKFLGKTYREVKLSAESYQAEWRQAKKDLGAWTTKPTHLEEFRLPTDKENF